ncbi:MAG: oligosaccharide flippase family protein [bacterium]|nr:oligosaccharide flippase family protein [bacterium]
MSLRDRLFADGLYTFAFRLITMGIAAVLGILTARMLGPAGRGIYAIPLVTLSLVSAGYAGLNNATAHFMLRYRVGRAVLVPAFISALLFVLAGIPATYLIARSLGAPWAAIPAALALPGPAMLAIFYGYQIGTDRVRMNTSYAALNTTLLLGLMLAALTIFGALPRSAILAWVVSSDLAALAAGLWLVVDARRLDAGTLETRRFAWYALRVGSVSLISLLNYRADVYVVAAFGGPTMLGMYTLAVTAAEMLLAATQVSAVVSSPQIGSLESSRAAAELTARCVRNNILVAAVACATLALVAPFAVRVLYGVAFMPMIPAFRVLLVGVFALSLGSPISSYFTIRLGKPQIPMMLAAVSAIICVGVSTLAIRHLGLVGAALGSTIGYLVAAGACIAVFARDAAVPVARVLVPRWSDVSAYAAAGSALYRQLRGAV